MGKRFGRNQRRRARELEREFVELAATNAMNYGLAKFQGERIRELKCVIDRFQHALGPNFIGLPLNELLVQVGRIDYAGSFRVPGRSGRAIQCAAMQTETRKDEVMDQVHFMVRLAGESVAYALSLRALHDTPPKYMAQRLAEQMAPVLLDAIRKQRGPHD